MLGSSTGSARRFAERARRHRRAALSPVLAGLAVLVLVAAGAWVLLASPLLVVRDVAVLGLDRLDRAAVDEVVDPSLGVPLARVDAHGLEEQLEALPLVDSAVVARVWPSDLEVRVVERVPVAALPVPGGYDVVDRSATTVMSTPEPPSDVPVVQVDLSTAGEGTVEAVTRVLDELPPELREQVATAGGTSRDGVVLELRDGARVVWGGAGSTPLKAEVLTSLLPRAAAVYDVSAPGWPVTRDA
ncbi:FtsQ-type POTRA domain-containing protein [Pseudokineococcus basanitobsidens]|uniref:FtsQ-type POTRA domain-containing protein n=1 Tax=Pseudokineococcus basanitobsidens TaxID=1926649 RepID=A0ABU8RHI2_9ACTN